MTNKDLIQTMNTISVIADKGETKIQKKLTKLFDKLKPYYETYTELVDGIRLENAQTDEKGILILDEKGNYRYSKDGRKKADKELKELLNKEIEFKKIEIINKEGFEEFSFLKDYITGVNFFIKEEEIDL
jgi:hypothetical protein